jgi:hypothetical protein
MVQPRAEDLEVVKNLLLYITLGEKVPKPPILPIYNALRRWLEAIAEKEDYKTLENFCTHTKILRPHVQILCVGEMPFSIANREHKLIPRLAPEHKTGTIVGIKKAGIMVSDERMPLCLPGEYWVARQDSSLQHLIELVSPKMVDTEEPFQKAWQNLLSHENPEDIAIVLRKLLKDMTDLNPELWQAICDTVAEVNKKEERKIVFLSCTKLTYNQMRDLGENLEFRLKIAHTQRVEEGVVMSQEPGLGQGVVVVGSGISPKLLQALQGIYEWAKTKGYIETTENWMELVRCNFFSFLLEESNSS